ncbi:hypothetical protein FA13DRAFT_1724442 [Coprinellus micaceus]|uniref:F-box domain-containing protein n=1 Tax=Coprinellus micaceus TaxID=71717 RepID=A0A4Y7U1A6_COPMI|nr:hypothetical protein FA13DRAFT_1724442 [Coprinellus micaceus]
MNLCQGLSNVDHILSTNNVPSSLEAASIKHGIEDLACKIRQTRTELEAMECQLRRHKAALSPIRRTPPEIIAQIIRFVAWGVLHSPGRQHLLWLSLVCRSWREAAMLCHEQWKGVHIEEKDVREPGAFEKIMCWYGRAGNLPKTLEFYLGGNDANCECEGGEEGESGGRCRFLNPTLVRLLKDRPTLDHFFLRISKPSCLFKLLDAISARNPSPDIPLPWVNLRSLILDFSDIDYVEWDDAERAAHSVFNYLPRVTSLTLFMPVIYAVFREDTSAARDASIHLPPSLLGNLTSFEVRCDWEGSHILRMLEHCPQLEKLTIDLFGSNLVHDDMDPLVRRAVTTRLLFPRLHTLKLESQKTLCVLDYLKTPALRSLYFDVFHGTSGRQVDQGFCTTFDLFMKESNCGNTLRSLELINIHTLPTGLAQSIVALRGLERLVLSQVSAILAQLLGSLASRVTEAAGSSDEPALPYLKDVALLKVPNHLAHQCILDFVRSLPSQLNLTISYDTSRSKPHTEQWFMEQLRNREACVRVIPDETLDWCY